MLHFSNAKLLHRTCLLPTAASTYCTIYFSKCVCCITTYILENLVSRKHITSLEYRFIIKTREGKKEHNRRRK
jgi:hypothetical protein